MKLVEVDNIPNVWEEIPLDDLLKVYGVCLEMLSVCKESDGVGLSAFQVGIPWKLFVVNFAGLEEFYIDCEYKPIGNEKIDSIEGCLSILNEDGSFRRFKVERDRRVNIIGKKLVLSDQAVGISVNDVDIDLEGTISIIFQHEIDHHNGILISDHGDEYNIHEAN
jgi:peptide deformylase